MKTTKNKKIEIVLDMANNSERANTIKIIESLGELRVEENGEKITLRLKSSKKATTPWNAQRNKKNYLLSHYGAYGASASNSGYRGLVENVAKLQDIALAKNDTSGTYSGIIAASAKKKYFCT